VVRGEATVLSARVRWLFVLAAALAALLLGATQVPRPHSVATFRLAAYGTQGVYYLVVACVVACIVGWWNAPLRWLLAAVVTLFALLMVLNVAGVPVASDLAKVGFAAVAGAAFVRAVERPWWLLPIAVCVPIADAWSVFSSRGVTHAVIHHARRQPKFIDWPTIATPIAGFPYHAFGRIGIVDVLFASLFLGIATRWQLGIRRGVVALAAGFLSTTVLVFEGAVSAVPALPLLCLAFLLAYAVPLARDARAARRESKIE
jgi:hypothetical protein